MDFYWISINDYLFKNSERLAGDSKKELK